MFLSSKEYRHLFTDRPMLDFEKYKKLVFVKI